MLMKSLSLILAISLVSSMSVAQQCDINTTAKLKACDAAYQAQIALIADQKEQIDNYFNKNILQDRIISDQQKRIESPTSDPVKMIALGAVGVVIVEIALGVFRK